VRRKAPRPPRKDQLIYYTILGTCPEANILETLEKSDYQNSQNMI
jgi:hypothetical protein